MSADSLGSRFCGSADVGGGGGGSGRRARNEAVRTKKRGQRIEKNSLQKQHDSHSI